MVFWCVDINFANSFLLNSQAVEAWGRGVVFCCFATVNNSLRHPEVDTISSLQMSISVSTQFNSLSKVTQRVRGITGPFWHSDNYALAPSTLLPAP